MIYFMVPYPLGNAASQRFRFEQYFEAMREEGIHFEIHPFWSAAGWKVLYQPGQMLRKTFYLLGGIISRWHLAFKMKPSDTIFVHREIYPTGTGFLIWFLSRIKKVRLIYDFDDAIWLPNYAATNKRFAFIKSYHQVQKLIKAASIVSVGNDYLKQYAKQYNANVVVNPTTIDTDRHHNQIKSYAIDNKLVIGWTGTHSTLKYLTDLLPIFDELVAGSAAIELLIISDLEPEFKRPYLNFVPWKKETEIEDLLKMDVGIMPLVDDQWSRGKCGFKALQYMSLGIPAIVSPVGVNLSIVVHEENGWVCDTPVQWKEVLEAILTNPTQLALRSKSARETIVAKYSVKSNRTLFLGLFKS